MTPGAFDGYQSGVFGLTSMLGVATALGFVPFSLPLVPKPAHVRRESGTFVVSRKTEIVAPGAAKLAGVFLAEALDGGNLTDEDGRKSIVLEVDESAQMGREAYKLSVTPHGVNAVASSPAGLFYAVQTLRQLGADAQRFDSRGEASLPCVEIEDAPRFAWRGLLLDVSRHFFSVPQIERLLDLMAQLKMNVFHWHLTDDGGWRIEIKKYPKLTSVGAWRKATPDWSQSTLSFPGTGPGDDAYGGYYTQDQIGEVVQYAADRNITIVPEIEMPGHSLAAIAAYPWLACDGYDRAGYQKKTSNPTANVFCAGSDRTFQFLEDVLDEVIALFPSKYIHVGGDEVDKFLWDHCPKCQTRMKANGLKNGAELETYFIHRIERYLNSRGRSLIGWDEILEGGLAPNAAVMSWRGVEGGVVAAKSKHMAVMSPTSPCYFDYAYNVNTPEGVYAYEPVPSQLDPAQAKYILGAQCNLWTEFVPTMRVLEQRLFPRILPMAEVLWSPATGRSWGEFAPRYGQVVSDFDREGVAMTMPAPSTGSRIVYVEKGAEVVFEPLSFARATLHYTLDGSDPQLSSPKATAGIPISAECTVRAAYVATDGTAGPIASVICVRPPEPVRVDVNPGLTYGVYRGTWQTMPDFATLQPLRVGQTATIGLSSAGETENYGFRLSGYLKVPVEGDYTFSLGSDDGSMMRLFNVVAIDNDGLHGMGYKSTKLHLKPGLYPLTVDYFQGGGDQGLDLQIEGPGIAKQPLPAAWLCHQK